MREEKEATESPQGSKGETYITSQQPRRIAQVWPDEASMHVPHLSKAGTECKD